MSPEPATQRTRRAARCRTHAPMKEIPYAALFLLFLLMMLTKCLAVSALADTDAATNAVATNAADTTLGILDLFPVRVPKTAIKSCKPDIIVLRSKAKYFCALENAAALRGLGGLMAGYYTGDKLNPFWDATLDEAAGGVSFTVAEGSGGEAGRQPFVISAVIQNRRYSVTNFIQMSFVDPAKTTATLNSNPHYGLSAAITTNLPQNSPRTPLYRMIPFGGDCQAECAANCYDVSTSKVLPPPGRYTLCVSASTWDGRYLRWGQSPLEVSALLTTSRYLVNGASNTLELLNAATGGKVLRSLFSSAYLARCPLAGCVTVPPVAPEGKNTEGVMSISVCYTSQRVKLEDGKPLVAESGLYVACFVDKEGKATPTALSTRVVPAPFSANATILSNTRALVSVSGGDIGQRTERYEVRVLRPGALCTTTGDLETKSIMRVLSDTPNSLSVTVTVPRDVNIAELKFCLVAADMTFWGQRYMAAFDMAVEVPEEVPVDKPEVKEEQKAEKVPVIWIIVGSVLGFVVLCAAVAAICICKRRNGKASNDSDVEANEPTADANYQPRKKSNRFRSQKTEELS